jgi:uncharacterized protein (TIGR02246 family)
MDHVFLDNEETRISRWQGPGPFHLYLVVVLAPPRMSRQPMVDCQTVSLNFSSNLEGHNMKRYGMRVMIGIVAVTAAGLILAQEKGSDSKSTRPDDEKAIRDASQGLARAFEKGDAKAVAAYWTEEGEYRDEDETPVVGRAALEKAYGVFFAKREQLTVEVSTDKVRFLGKDAAIEEGTFTVRAKGSPPDASRYSAFYVRQDSRWLIALLKEWGDEKTAKANIDNLAWLIGSWESENGDSKSTSKYEWTDNKKFIRCQYNVQIKLKDKAIRSTGTQLIGVDPAVGLIHAWTFDSEGGVGEASWTWDGGRWVIDSTGTLPDGTTLNATNFLTKAGNDAFTWRSVSRTSEGDPLPDLPAVKVKRVKD